jgi:hypothetical protein
MSGRSLGKSALIILVEHTSLCRKAARIRLLNSAFEPALIIENDLGGLLMV